MRRERARSLAALALVASLAGACATPPPPPAERPDRERVIGTRVSLPVTPGFEPSQHFSGLMDPETLASVMVTELPHPAASVVAGMNREALAARGAELLETEVLRVDGRQAWMIHAASEGRSERGTHRWMLVSGDESGSFVVSAAVPGAFAVGLAPVLRDMLLATTWEPGLELSPYDGLGFEIEETADLKRSDRLPQMVSFTRGGMRGALAPEAPLFLAGVSTAPLAIADLAAFSHRQLAGVTELSEIVVLSEAERTLDGLPAYEIHAAARDRESGSALQVYQMIAIDGRAYFPLQGSVGADLASDFIPQFRSIAQSFRRTDASAHR